MIRALRVLTFVLILLGCAAFVGLSLQAQLAPVKNTSTPAKAEPPPAEPATPVTISRVLELRINDVIEPMTFEYVNDGFEEAARSQAGLILITMQTPGGLDSAMRDIIQRILASPVPVVVYISPSGSRAASAGFYILESADIAAMAPGTNTGAASPVLINILSGASVPMEDTMKKKILSDASAYLRSITSKRGRNVEEADKAIMEARSFTEKEALQLKLIDVVANSKDDLLAQLNGREVTRFDGRKVTLQMKSPQRAEFAMTARQRFLGRILHPDVFLILLVIGVLGLYAEFTHPGMIFPGVIGGISIVLALYAMRLLPVTATGLLLIALAMVLFVLEAKFTSHGILGIGGAVAMFLGALMLIHSPITGMGVSIPAALGVTLPFALITVFLMRLVLQSFRWKSRMGAEHMRGMTGEVTQAIRDGQGMVFVDGELWRAVAAQEIPKGAAVRVVKVDGLKVHVEPLSESSQTSN